MAYFYSGKHLTAQVRNGSFQEPKRNAVMDEVPSGLVAERLMGHFQHAGFNFAAIKKNELFEIAAVLIAYRNGKAGQPDPEPSAEPDSCDAIKDR